MSDIEKAKKYFDEGVKHFEEGEYDKAINDNTKAIGLLSKIIKDDPDYVVNYAAAYNNRGTAYSNKGEYDKAIDDFTKAIEFNPDYHAAYNNRGNAYDEKGEYDKAIEDYTEVIRLNPDFAGAYNNRGFAYYHQSDYDKAIENYNTAIELNPKLADAYNNRGIAYAYKEGYDKAIDDFNKTIELKPDYANAYNNRGNAYYNKGEYDKTIEDYTEAIRLNPKYTNAYNYRGLAYAYKEDYEKAINDFSTAIELKPDYAEAYNNRGNAYGSKGEYDKAIKDFTKAIELKPDSDAAYYNRGLAYTEKGDSDKASKDFTKAIELEKAYKKAIKLKTISITNYKGIDSFTLDFSSPKVAGDPEILAMGSKNGLGKTSIMECCSLILMCLHINEKTIRLKTPFAQVDIPDLLIRAGAKYAKITGDIAVDNKTIKITLYIDRKGFMEVKKDQNIKFDKSFNRMDDDIVELITTICGFSLNPVISNRFLFFHSYRKVQEGNTELGMMVNDYRDSQRMSPSNTKRSFLSKFKIILLKSMMNKADLFESEVEKQLEDATIETLNKLIKTYANGKMGKLKAFSESTVDFRVELIDSKESITFDGLSSGQKEIISTLFLIWYHTIDNPSVILIDEPELHLNAQWHHSFIRDLIKLAPDNQYIIATHSEDIMASVSKDQRVLLSRQGK